MAPDWSRRAFLATTGASIVSSALIACGSSTVESAITPSRFIAFGDGLSDLGNKGSRYTVNDGTVNVWVQQLASSYGVAITASANGGSGFAVGNARVTGKPDASGNADTPTVTEQISNFLATSAFGASDVALVQGGISDVIYNHQRYTQGTISSSQFSAALTQAGTELGAQVRRLVTAGAKYVVVTGTYYLGSSPWASKLPNEASIITSAAAAFNTALLLAISDLASNVLYVDSAYYFNLLINSPASYSLVDSTTVVCTSTDVGDGLGIGSGQVNSALCTASTIASGLAYDSYLFADPVYFTPAANRMFGTYAYDRLKARF